MSINHNPKHTCLQKVLSVITSASLILALVPSVPAHAQEEQRWSDSIDAMLAVGAYAEGEVIVALLGDEDDALTAQAGLPVDELEPLMEVGAEAAGVSPTAGIVAQAEQDVTLSLVSSDSLSTEEILRSLADDPRVAFAEPNYYAELAADEQAEAVASVAASEGLVSQATGAMNDLRFLQWGNYTIHVPSFNDTGTGANMDGEVVVALLDGNVDFTNPDLADRAYVFSPSLQDQLGCDVNGFNASAESTDGKFARIPLSVMECHGTHCAGIIGATWDGHGVSGVASNVKIVSIQMAGTRTDEENRRTSLGNALRAFGFVKRANDAGVGIQVTSNSWSLYQTSKALDAAVYEVGQTQGVVSVFAASNEGRNNDIYALIESTLYDNPYAIVVAASDHNDELASFSSYGPSTVELAAPGLGILSTTASGDGTYIPTASDSDIMFEDFEGDVPLVKVQQIDAEGNLVGEPASISMDTQVIGDHSIKVPIDPAYTIEGGGGWFPIYSRGVRLDFDLAAAQEKADIDIVQSLASAQDLYVGLAIAGPSDCSMAYLDHAKSNMTGDEEFDSFSQSYSANGLACITYAPLYANDVARDVDSLNGHLLVDLFFSVDDETSYIYLDFLGIGTEMAPYVYKSGTSMACPTVAGATAVLASQSGLTGAQLASLVRSKVRIPDAGPLELRTGGVFDFDVQGSPESGGEQASSPAITSVEVNGTTVTITGSNFGSRQGSATLVRYITGQKDGDDSALAAEVLSWADDKVILTLKEPFTGILRATLANVSGKYDTTTRFVSKGETVYEQDLPFGTDTDATFMLDGMGDFETEGPLVGLGCKLYYLPAEQPVELSPSYQRMFCFDLKDQTWTELLGLPEPLQGVSAVMFEGKIVVEGATMQILPSGEPTNEFVGGEEPQERVYVYDPTMSTWLRASNEGMCFGQTIVNNDGQLMLVAGTRMSEPDEEGGVYPENAPAFNYSLSKGAFEELYPVYGAMLDPQVVVRNGNLLLYSPKNYDLSKVVDGQPSMCHEMLPNISSDIESPMSYGQVIEDPHMGRGVLMNASEGIIFVGPLAEDGSTETYILRDGAEAFVPYGKRASDDRVYNPAACTYRGRLFVIGSAWFEPNQRLFRATAIDVDEYPGDIPCDDKPAPAPAPAPAPTPTPANVTPSTPSSGTASANKVASKALPKTGDATLHIAVPFAGALGVLALAFGLYQRVSPALPQAPRRRRACQGGSPSRNGSQRP